jgi:DNA-binding response OmpR family regulator
MDSTERLTKILVCEDSHVINMIIQYRLVKDGYDVEIAKDGQVAMEKLGAASYDLIITDLLMPFTGGLELINKIRNELHLKIPIIVVSALDHESSIIEALKLGADDYITKPFSPSELSIRVRKLLIRR